MLTAVPVAKAIASARWDAGLERAARLRPKKRIVNSPEKAQLVKARGLKFLQLAVWFRHLAWVNGKAMDWLFPICNSSYIMMAE